MNLALVEGLLMASGSVRLSFVLIPECLNLFLPFFPLIFLLRFFVDSASGRCCVSCLGELATAGTVDICTRVWRFCGFQIKNR